VLFSFFFFCNHSSVKLFYYGSVQFVNKIILLGCDTVILTLMKWKQTLAVGVQQKNKAILQSTKTHNDKTWKIVIL